MWRPHDSQNIDGFSILSIPKRFFFILSNPALKKDIFNRFLCYLVLTRVGSYFEIWQNVSYFWQNASLNFPPFYSQINSKLLNPKNNTDKFFNSPLFCTCMFNTFPKVSSFYHLCLECFSQFSFDSEIYTKSTAVSKQLLIMYTFLNQMRIGKLVTGWTPFSTTTMYLSR